MNKNTTRDKVRVKVLSPITHAAPTRTTDEALEWLTEQVLKAKIEGPFGTVAWLDPALAKVLLGLNLKNRPIRKRVLNDLVHDIQSGKFVLNGETIVISLEGEVNDGQHRCLAVQETNIPVQTFIAFGLSRASRMTLDTGVARTTGDFLGMRDDPPSGTNVAASIARMLHLYQNSGHVDGNTVTSKDRPTKADIQGVYTLYKSQIDGAMKRVPKVGASLFGSWSVTCFCYIILSRIDRAKAGEFIDMLYSGANLPEYHPVLTCRARFGRDRGGLKPAQRIELIFRTWNLWRRGQTVKSIPIMDNLPVLEK